MPMSSKKSNGGITRSSPHPKGLWFLNEENFMIALKIKNTKVYPSYYNSGLVIFSGETKHISEESITQSIVDDVKAGNLEVVSGSIPANFLYPQGGY